MSCISIVTKVFIVGLLNFVLFRQLILSTYTVAILAKSNSYMVLVNLHLTTV